MFNFLQSLFKKKEYSLGCFPNHEDIRDIHISSVQVPVSIPLTYKTDISMLDVENQMAHGTCVGQAVSKLVEMYLERRGQTIPVKLSARSLYVRSKAQDGIPNLQGTIPRVTANVLIKEGIAPDWLVPDDNTLPYDKYMSIDIDATVKEIMDTRKLAGYVAVSSIFDDVKQAIYQNGAVTASLPVDANWFSGLIKRPYNVIGYHYVLLTGYDQKGIFFRNSWGDTWGDKGDSYFVWDDYSDKIRDIIAFTDIPKDILDNVKKVQYQFSKTMKLGDKSNDVLELQKRLESEGLWPITSPKTGYYGLVTSEMVYKYQMKYKVALIDVLFNLRGRSCGPATIKELNKNTMTSKIELWIEAIKKHEGYFAGSRSFRNNNIGNLRYVGQKTAIGKDKEGFCIFPDYETGYNELKNMLLRACLGNSRVYSPEDTILSFYEKYAPSFENDTNAYAVYVAKQLGVDITTKIKTLI